MANFYWRPAPIEMCNFFARHREPRDGRVMAFAGLWDQWRGPTDAPDAPLAVPLWSFSIATCAPNATAAPIHDRMPVLFTRDAEWDAWLHPDGAPDELRKMFAAADDDLLETFPVTRYLLPKAVGAH